MHTNVAECIRIFTLWETGPILGSMMANSFATGPARRAPITRCNQKQGASRAERSGGGHRATIRCTGTCADTSNKCKSSIRPGHTLETPSACRRRRQQGIGYLQLGGRPPSLLRTPCPPAPVALT